MRDNITSISSSQLWRICDTNDNVFRDFQDWSYCFRHNVFDVTLTDTFKYQSEYVDTDHISVKSKQTIHITDKREYLPEKPLKHKMRTYHSSFPMNLKYIKDHLHK